jgi:hypothetical protein
VDDYTSLLNDGWILWNRGSGGTTDGLMVYAQLYADNPGERGHIGHLFIMGRELSSDRVRNIPIGRIEALANTNPDFKPHIIGIDGDEPGAMLQAVRALQSDANRQLMNMARRKASRNPEPPQPRTPLTRPDRSDPDGFYRQVADAYRDVVKSTSKVAVVLAEEADVPVGTVHRWILEARRRGFLPTARQGRVG